MCLKRASQTFAEIGFDFKNQNLNLNLKTVWVSVFKQEKDSVLYVTKVEAHGFSSSGSDACSMTNRVYPKTETKRFRKKTLLLIDVTKLLDPLNARFYLLSTPTAKSESINHN